MTLLERDRPLSVRRRRTEPARARSRCLSRVTASAFALAILACDSRADLTPAPAPVARAPSVTPPVSEREPVEPPRSLFAKRFVVAVRAAPSRQAARIGYLRGGVVLRSKGGVVGTDGCRRGWYELETGGFVCSGRDVTAFEGPRLPERRSLPADRDAKLPYAFAAIRSSGTPIYRRAPTSAEILEIEHGIPPDAGVAMPADVDAPTEETPAVARKERDGTTVAEAAVESDTAESDDDAEPSTPTLASLEGARESPLLRRAMRGFLVSLDRELDLGGRKYQRTQANGFIPSDRLVPVPGSDFRGLASDDGALSLPVAFVIGRDVHPYEVATDGRARRLAETVSYHQWFRVVGEREVRGHAFVEGPDGRLYRERDIRRIDASPRPAPVGADEKWLDFDLSTQSVVAYEGDRPVYVTLVSSGRKRPSDPDDYLTPTGTFRITSKHLTHQMDGDTAMDGPYSIEDVPYVMYFQLAYAAHSAFWHDLFGRPKSHGCLNLAPHDARWLFEWSSPALPRGWHSVYPTEDAPGTFLRIRGEAPRR